MEPPSEKNAASDSRARVLSWGADFLFLLGGAASITAFTSSQWRASLHLILPLGLLPLFGYLLYRLFGQTPGQYIFGMEWRMPGGARARRVYDWLFSVQLTRAPSAPNPFQRLILISALLVFSVGADAYLWMSDLTIRPFAKSEIPLFAPDPNDPKWTALPFFYATGAVPMHLGVESEPGIEFGLPYERGPPNRFIGKITAYWRTLDSRLTYTGPFTFGAPDSQSALEDCFTKWMGCTGSRRKIWKTSISPLFEGRTIVKNQWFKVRNEFLPTEERAQGIYLRARPERGRIREAYFLVGPKMALQGIILDRPDREEGEAASLTLARMIGSIRLSGDLAAPRAFINPKLAGLKIGPKSGLSELIQAEGHLLAKVSIEPKEAESFYHLAGLGITLFRRAKTEGRIELAASSKTIVKSALQFAKDIEPESKRLPEMEKFATETQ